MSISAFCRKVLPIVFLIICCLVLPAAADPTAYTSQFSKLATARSETLAIMGGDEGASGGIYKFYYDGTSMNITKLSGKGAIGKERRLAGTDIHWLPLLGGTVGYIHGENRYYNNPVLVNNTERFTTFAVGGEAGAKILLGKKFSITPALGLIYSRSDSEFLPGTALGAQLKQQYAGQLFDWYVDTITMAPSIEAQYQETIGKDWRLTLSSRYAWFNTWDIASSSRYLEKEGDSFNWENKVDLDVRLPLKLFNRPLHTGGYVSVDYLGGDFRDTVGSNAMYTFNGRLVLGDFNGLWKLNWVGLGVSWIKANTFYGYSVGLDMRMRF